MSLSSEGTPNESSFHCFGLLEGVVQSIEAAGYSVPTPIQARTIPFLLTGRDVLGQAQTGTGKTAAFALPMLQQIDLETAKPQVLVLTPTRELAIQVADAFEKYGSCLTGLRVAAIYGGQDYQIQFRQLDRGAHVIVGTPGRVMDHMRRQSLQLDGLKALVLDEADEMLRMGFIDDVEWVLSQLPEKRQMALFSATMPEPIRRIADRYLHDPEHITIAQQSATADTVRQRFMIVPPRQKEAALERLLEAEPIDAVLVFAKTRSTCDPLADFLSHCGHRTAALHGEIPQKQRERIIDQLRRGKIDVIVATDVAARGLDVQRISHVINFDVPMDNEVYVHRIGRTGRAGKSGEAILFVTPWERSRLKRLEYGTRQRIEQMELPSNREINKQRVERFHAQITQALNHPETETFSSVIDQYRRAHPEVPETRIAAALAALAHGETTFFEKREFVIVADEERGPRSRRERTRGPHERSNDRTHSSAPNNFESYRIELGRDHQVNPGHIVGAITNELGVNRSLIGRIKILDQFSIVELPANLSPEMWQALQKVFVLGKKMQIRPAGRSSDADRPMGTANSSGPNLDRTERHRASRRSDSENRSTERSRSRKGKFGFKNRRKQGEQIATF